MMPVIALIGRSNVGKSTLFNRLTFTRDALVANFPGLTRDRKYGRTKWENYECIIIDTGGIDVIKERLESNTAIKQSLIAIEDANIVLFVVDGRDGFMAADQNIANYLRKRQKTTIIVVNKTDCIDFYSVIGDFYALGISNVIPIAASQGSGMSNLIKKISELIIKEKNILSEHSSDYGMKCSFLSEDNRSHNKIDQKKSFHFQMPSIKLAIVGRPNVGKSTLINCLLGEERLLVCDRPGTTRDSVYIPIVYNKQRYILIDTAGVRKHGNNIKAIVEKFSVIKTLQAIGDAHVVVLMIDAAEGIVNQDVSLLSYIINRGRSLVIAINKWDNVSMKKRDYYNKILNLRLRFIDFSRFHFISALQGGSGIKTLFNSVNEAYQCATKRISTSLLTRIMHMAIDAYSPPLVHGRRIKPKYAHVAGYNPPTIVIHGTQVKFLSDSYKRYLTRYFRHALNIIGTPIRIQFNESTNPFFNPK